MSSFRTIQRTDADIAKPLLSDADQGSSEETVIRLPLLQVLTRLRRVSRPCHLSRRSKHHLRVQAPARLGDRAGRDIVWHEAPLGS